MKSPKMAFALAALILAFTTACGSDDAEPNDKAGPSSSAGADPSTGASDAPGDKKSADDEPVERVELPGEMKQKGGKSTNDGDRPSADELAESLKTKNVLMPYKVSEKEAQCIAEIVVESDLSDGAIRAIVGKDVTFKASKKDEEILRDLNPEYRKKCLD